MKFEILLEKILNWLPFILIVGIVIATFSSEFGCAVSAKRSIFHLTENIADSISSHPTLLG